MSSTPGIHTHWVDLLSYESKTVREKQAAARAMKEKQETTLAVRENEKALLQRHALPEQVGAFDKLDTVVREHVCYACGEDDLTDENGGVFVVHGCGGVVCRACVDHHEALLAGVGRGKSGVFIDEKKTVQGADKMDTERYRCLKCNFYIDPNVFSLVPNKNTALTKMADGVADFHQMMVEGAKSHVASAPDDEGGGDDQQAVQGGGDGQQGGGGSEGGEDGLACSYF